MEILFAFLGGLILTSVVAFFVARSVVKNRVSAAEQSVAVKSEALLDIDEIPAIGEGDAQPEEVRQME